MHHSFYLNLCSTYLHLSYTLLCTLGYFGVTLHCALWSLFWSTLYCALWATLWATLCNATLCNATLWATLYLATFLFHITWSHDHMIDCYWCVHIHLKMKNKDGFGRIILINVKYIYTLTIAHHILTIVHYTLIIVHYILIILHYIVYSVILSIYNVLL